MPAQSKLKELLEIWKHRKLLRSVVASYMFFLRNPDKSVWGSITKEDEIGIGRAVEAARAFNGPIVEIGALFGHTTNLIASLKSPDTPLIAVENFTWNPFFLDAEVHRQFTKRTLRFVMDHCNTSIFDGDAEKFYQSGSHVRPSMVFIDALHNYEGVKRDIEWAVESQCPVITGHDYTDLHPGVVRAVNEFFGDKISVTGSVWMHCANS